MHMVAIIVRSRATFLAHPRLARRSANHPAVKTIENGFSEICGRIIMRIDGM